MHPAILLLLSFGCVALLYVLSAIRHYLILQVLLPEEKERYYCTYPSFLFFHITNRIRMDSDGPLKCFITKVEFYSIAWPLFSTRRGDREVRFIKKLIITFFLVSTVLVANSQEKLNLDSIFSAIVNNHPELKMYDAQIRSLDEAAKGAKNWEAPRLSTGLWMAPYNPGLWSKQNDGSAGMGQYMVSGEQMFPNRKMQNAEQKYMESMSSVEKEKKNATINELYAQAKRNYFEWVIAEKKLAVLDRDEKMLDFMIKNAELRFKNNLGKISAYYKAKASLGNIQSMRIMLENELTQKRISLNTLMNRHKTTLFDVDTSYAIKDYSTLSIDSTTFINSRSDLKAVDRDIEVAGLQQQLEKTKLKPEFGIRFDHMFGFGGLPMQYSLMGMVRLPMAKWSSRTSRANIASLQWKIESLNEQKRSLINEASGMATGMLTEIQSRQKQINLYEDNIVPALRKNFQTMQLAYENNTEELFELYDAWETLNMTQLQYLDMLQQLLLMRVELEKVLEIK